MYKVLIADDESIERKAISIILGKNDNFKLIGEANNGIDVIEKAKNLNPDVILMDIKMPGMDGIKATKEILKTNPSIKTIIITAYDEFQYAQQAIKIGAIDYLLKPVRPDDLMESIYKAVLYKTQNSLPINSVNLKTYLEINKNVVLFEKIKIGDKMALKIEINKLIEEHLSITSDDIKEFTTILFFKIVDFISSKNDFIEDKLLKLCDEFSAEISKLESIAQIKKLIYDYIDIVFNIIILYKPYKPSLIKEALKYIDENYNKNITLEDVAKYVHLNPQYLSRYFKKTMNMNFVDYISKIRINSSKKLLSETDLSINSIALKVGYTDQSYFCKVFKKIEGISPNKFRKNLKL
ncbi:response regulator [Thermoanaerobacterium thermosaccharolyticum]|uniref:Stage 0 sporulation protein A homolog n=1 Tax=Thermoanaerobacterium thermosaccharolyticum M0795 TaxID=698948 RepID=L0INA1_THETR|nr:response regulator [Thermoanaerobacterium thermosaccharolyticum]AGB19716.1 response regulator containing CheY-like receiver domain and AraC-type DNA-binding domain [Thermoanaerobacterium thermosaccharolyticum M0795]